VSLERFGLEQGFVGSRTALFELLDAKSKKKRHSHGPILLAVASLRALVEEEAKARKQEN